MKKIIIKQKPQKFAGGKGERLPNGNTAISVAGVQGEIMDAGGVHAFTGAQVKITDAAGHNKIAVLGHRPSVGGASGTVACAMDSDAELSVGYHGIAVSLAWGGRVKGGEDSILVLYDKGTHTIIVGKVGENGIEPNTWYKARYGEMVKVTAHPI